MRKLVLNKPASLWFCGLSGAGKTTVSLQLKTLIEKKTETGVVLLDGDEMVKLFSSSHVDHSEDARTERVKKYLQLVGILLKTPNLLPVVVMINHSSSLRQMIKDSPLSGHYFEVFINTSIDLCKLRDPKGHYQKAEKSAVPQMIGIDLPFNMPGNPDVEISEKSSPEEAAETIFQQLCKEGIFISNG